MKSLLNQGKKQSIGVKVAVIAGIFGLLSAVITCCSAFGVAILPTIMGRIASPSSISTYYAGAPLSAVFATDSTGQANYNITSTTCLQVVSSDASGHETRRKLDLRSGNTPDIAIGVTSNVGIVIKSMQVETLGFQPITSTSAYSAVLNQTGGGGNPVTRVRVPKSTIVDGKLGFSLIQIDSYQLPNSDAVEFVAPFVFSNSGIYKLRIKLEGSDYHSNFTSTSEPFEYRWINWDNLDPKDVTKVTFAKIEICK